MQAARSGEQPHGLLSPSSFAQRVRVSALDHFGLCGSSLVVLSSDPAPHHRSDSRSCTPQTFGTCYFARMLQLTHSLERSPAPRTSASPVLLLASVEPCFQLLHDSGPLVDVPPLFGEPISFAQQTSPTA